MRRFQGLQRGILLTVILALLCGFCLAEGPGTEEKGLDLAEGRISVRYPAVIGMEDEALQKSVNDRIVADCGIGDYLSRQ